jgi:hypothetical protein
MKAHALHTSASSVREKWTAPEACPPKRERERQKERESERARERTGFAPTARTALPRAAKPFGGASFLSAPGMRIVVSVNGVKFRVPITDNTSTVGWLCGDVAARYVRHHKLGASADLR